LTIERGEVVPVLAIVLVIVVLVLVLALNAVNFDFELSYLGAATYSCKPRQLVAIGVMTSYYLLYTLESGLYSCGDNLDIGEGVAINVLIFITGVVGS
jgi:hypothetical protein